MGQDKNNFIMAGMYLLYLKIIVDKIIASPQDFAAYHLNWFSMLPEALLARSTADSCTFLGSQLLPNMPDYTRKGLSGLSEEVSTL